MAQKTCFDCLNCKVQTLDNVEKWWCKERVWEFDRLPMLYEFDFDVLPTICPFWDDMDED